MKVGCLLSARLSLGRERSPWLVIEGSCMLSRKGMRNDRSALLAYTLYRWLAGRDAWHVMN
jgi:hypothetical protein